jgi:hypothetical protein
MTNQKQRRKTRWAETKTYCFEEQSNDLQDNDKSHQIMDAAHVFTKEEERKKKQTKETRN